MNAYTEKIEQQAAEIERLRTAMRSIAQRANESGTGEMAERETIYAMYRIAVEVLKEKVDEKRAAE